MKHLFQAASKTAFDGKPTASHVQNFISTRQAAKNTQFMPYAYTTLASLAPNGP